MCPECSVFYQKFIREANDDESDQTDICNDWTPDLLYKHLESKHCDPVETKVLDPMMANPNSKFNIAALSTKLYRDARIKETEINVPLQEDGLKREKTRQFTYIAADAAIALQVILK
jgi:hypothetical protein